MDGSTSFSPNHTSLTASRPGPPGALVLDPGQDPLTLRRRWLPSALRTPSTSAPSAPTARTAHGRLLPGDRGELLLDRRAHRRHQEVGVHPHLLVSAASISQPPQRAPARSGPAKPYNPPNCCPPWALHHQWAFDRNSLTCVLGGILPN